MGVLVHVGGGPGNRLLGFPSPSFPETDGRDLLYMGGDVATGVHGVPVCKRSDADTLQDSPANLAKIPASLCAHAQEVSYGEKFPNK